jgi:hypothetical protein
MTRKSRRELEREVNDLAERAGGGAGGILILCEHEDGTVTDPSGDPVTESEYENAGVVIEYLSWDVVQTWPDADDSGAGDT